MTANFAPTADPTNIEGRRICAWSIDLALFLALVFGVLFATGGFAWHTKEFDSSRAAIDYCNAFDTGRNDRGCVPYDRTAVIVNVRGSADGVWLAYTLGYIILQGITGASPGKLVMGLRVVDVNGKLAGLGKSFLRTVLWVVDAITCGIPIVGGVLMVSTRGHRRVGDMGAGTFVVRKASVGSPITLPPALPAPLAHYPMPGYGPAPGYGPPAGYGQPGGHGAPPPYPGRPEPTATWQPPPPGWTDAPAAVGAPPAPPPYPAPHDGELSRPSIVPPTTDGPHWDDDRDTYIQYDRAVESWVQWDEDARIWRPIET